MQVLRQLTMRMKRIIIVTCCAFVCIALSLFYLQIANSHFFFRLSQRNFLREEKIETPRGNITDQHGTVLATNRPVYTVYWQGTGNHELTLHQKNIIASVTDLCGLPQTEIGASLVLIERRSSRLKLVSDISFDLLTRLLELWPEEKNIFIEKTFKRFYPYNELACHIVGYLGLETGSVGKMGLEHIYNKELKGHSGTILKIINSIGHNLKAHQLSAGLAGKTLQTTLDADLQRLAEEIFPVDYEGSLILMDDTGGLEVVLSRPSFDPAVFLNPISTNQWKELKEKKGFINRAFTACYPPASLFKLITLAAALETGVISRTMQWHCIGHTSFKGRTYHCHNKEGHGVLNTEQALAHSCNIPFYEIGKHIKIDTLANYAHRFGLGSKTGILFPEKKGLIPTNAWKLMTKGERWQPGETLSAVIGQTSLLVTPLQIAVLIHALCTGTKVRPRVLVDEPIMTEPVDIQKDTLSFLQQCLRSVIRQGTGAYLKYLPHFKISGKSGTAQVQSLDKKILIKEQLPHGYFAAQFQYKNEKPKTLVILIEHAASSSVAMKVALTFLKKYAAHAEQKLPAPIPCHTI